MKIDKENILNFIDYNYIPIKKKQLLSRIFVIWLLSIPCCFLGSDKMATAAFLGAANFIITCYSIKILFLKSIPSKWQNLFVGADLIYVSVILTLLSYKFATLNLGDKPWLFLTLLGLIIIGGVLFILLAYHLIKKGAYKKGTPRNNKILIYSAIGGLSGFLASRLLLRNLSQESNVILISSICMMFALLMSVGSIFLLKFFLQIYLEKMSM